MWFIIETSFTDPVLIWWRCWFFISPDDTFDTDPNCVPLLAVAAFGGKLNGKLLRFVLETLRVGVGGGGGLIVGGLGGATVGRPIQIFLKFIINSLILFINY